MRFKKELPISFEKLQIFLLLCELQSFSLVAKELNTNQSVISRSIKELEKLLSKKLISNNQKPIILTKEGKFLKNTCNKIYFETQHIQENLTQEKKYFAGYIKILIALPISYGLLIGEKIKKLFSAMPEIGIDFSFTNNITLNVLNKNDIVITKESFNHILVENFFVQEYDICFGANKEYIKKFGFPQHIDQLSNHQFIFVKNYYYEELSDIDLTKYLSKHHSIENEIAYYKAIEYGAGVGIIPKFALQSFPKIYGFELSTKLNKLKIHISVSKVKKNSYIELIQEFLKREL